MIIEQLKTLLFFSNCSNESKLFIVISYSLSYTGVVVGAAACHTRVLANSPYSGLKDHLQK